MKRLVFLLIALLVVSSYGEESAFGQRRKSSFYFDATVGMALRHLEAVQAVHDYSESSPACHFEPDGRYVCGEKSSGGKYGSYEKEECVAIDGSNDTDASTLNKVEYAALIFILALLI